ncbi:MAG: hypothetical protein K6B14_10525 [Lachnospiraceae bacterium]|nr:hypothetical protein [Lachnospiraceae bacterium]
MRGKYKKIREQRKNPKKKKRILPWVLLALLLIFCVAAIIGTAVIFAKSGELTLWESFLAFLDNAGVAVCVVFFFFLGVCFLDIVGRTTHFLLGDGFGDIGDGLPLGGGGGGGSSGGGGSFGGGGSSR